ncbi:orange carotenoid protein N-terminal domain-containing protein [Gloeothece verrucosa]|uniref:Orange carotenoid protein n=1 Tax=Gloeothece verrucosa (strain PCC 7822) TaxID=497965 RepID=E0UAJ5_GLOV7|nr:orange carotenoid protein N-terminal domain-containing protein [Gloeothece verrucosa]ADN12736.1 Orange carotenoid protein [Gloeothece verrucosa PCC 7822]
MTGLTDTSSNILSKETQAIFEEYNQLNTDDKLALLYYIYEKMGDSITPAGTNAINVDFLSSLIEDFLQLSDNEQLEIMRDIVNAKDSEYSRYYGGLSPNNQLFVWYAWAEAMGDTVVDIPGNYKATEAVNNALSKIEGLDFEAQISILREIASNMGYSDVKNFPTQDDARQVTPSL